jgi:hypothetical protein
VIWRCRNKQVRAFTILNEPKLPSPPELDVEAAVAKERSKPAAPLRFVVQPAPRDTGWATAIHGCNGIGRLVCEDEDQCGNCFDHGFSVVPSGMSAMDRKRTYVSRRLVSPHKPRRTHQNASLTVKLLFHARTVLVELSPWARPI